MKSAPAFHRTMRLVYESLTVQMTLVVLLLGFTGRLAWLRVYRAGIHARRNHHDRHLGAGLPAEGVWMHDALHDPTNPNMLPAVTGAWPIYAGIRDGGSPPCSKGIGAEGIITFPSLHAGLGVDPDRRAPAGACAALDRAVTRTR